MQKILRMNQEMQRMHAFEEREETKLNIKITELENKNDESYETWKKIQSREILIT